MTKRLSTAIYILVALAIMAATAWVLFEPQQQPNRADFGTWR